MISLINNTKNGKKLSILFFILVINFFFNFRDTQCQLEVLSISSYRECAEVDPSVTLGGPLDGLGQFLNCTPSPDNPNVLPLVTTMDLRLQASLDSDTEFLVNLTVVRGDPNQDPSASPVECDPLDPTSQLCTATSPAKIKIKTTSAKYSYALEEIDLKIPYAYMSATEFIDSSLITKSSKKCKDLPACVSKVVAHCSPSKLEKKSTSAASLCNTLRQTILGQGSISSTQTSNPALNLWERFNTLPNTTYMNYLRDNDITQLKSLFRSGGDQSYSCEYDDDDYQVFFSLDNEVHMGNIYYTTNRQSNGVNLCTIEQKELDGIEKSSTFSPIGVDNYTIDIRTGVFRPMPCPEGIIPSNIYQVNDLSITEKITGTNVYIAPSGSELGCEKPINSGLNDFSVDKVDVQSTSPDTDLAIIECSSTRCEANIDTRVNVTDSKAAGGALRGNAVFTNTLNTIVSLNPECTVYKVNPDPQVQMEVKIEIEIVGPDGETVVDTQNLDITNFGQSKDFGASELKLIRGRIENVETISSKLGPTIDGYIVVCGREDGFIDMSSIVSQNRNPWPTFTSFTRPPPLKTNWDSCRCPKSDELCNIEDFDRSYNNDCCYPTRINFFPHPSDYSPRGKYGKPGDDDPFNPSVEIPNDKGVSFWYYVSADDAAREFGTGCNQVGMKSSWFLNSNNAQTMCGLPTHECVPGVGRHYNGGKKLTVPAHVSATFLRASGAMRFGTIKTTQQFQENGDVVYPQEENPLFFLNTTINEELLKALRFMPNDPFLAANNQTLYNEKDPNFWLSAKRGRSLMYEPSTSQKNGGLLSSASLTAEVVIDFVGTFLGYETQVAKGKIIIDSISGKEGNDGQQCISAQQNGNITLSVENLSLPPFSNISGDYFLTVDCRPEVTGIIATASGVSPESNRIRIDSIPPGNTSDPIVFDLVAEGTSSNYALPPDELFCWANLTSSSSSLVLNIDTIKVACGITPPFSNPYISVISPNTTSPPATPVKCDGCFDTKCWIDTGEPQKACVLWIVVLIFFGAVLAVVGSTIRLCVFYFRQKTQKQTSQVEFSKFRKQKKKELGLERQKRTRSVRKGSNRKK